MSAGRFRLIPDVNVLLSGATSERGPARALYLAALRFEVTFVLGEGHFMELRRVLTYPSVLRLGGGITPSDAFSLAVNLYESAQVMRQVERFDWPSCPNPKDWYLLDLFVAAQPDAVVTKDSHLLRLRDRLHIPVVEPRELVRLGVV